MESTGKIRTANTNMAFCKFDGSVAEGAQLYYQDGEQRIGLRVLYLQAKGNGSTIGNAAIVDLVHRPPASGTQLYVDENAQKPRGVNLDLARDPTGRSVPVRLNALFKHMLIGGMTQCGKTHAGIAIAEELERLEVPHLILDIQNEFTHLPANFDTVVLDDEPEPSQILDLLSQRKTVVVSMLGRTDDSKAKLANAILSHIWQAKERDHANGSPELPPMLVTIDEAEVLAPGNHVGPTPAQKECRSTIEMILKRGSKLGLGAILICLRLPMMHVESRSQCNSAALFVLEDEGSLKQLKLKGLTRYEQDTINRLGVGQCFLRGPIVGRPTMVKIRAIVTPRTKNVDFEAMLGFEPAPRQPGAPTITGPTSINLAAEREAGAEPVEIGARLSPSEVDEAHCLELQALCLEPATLVDLQESLKQAGQEVDTAELERRLEKAVRSGSVRRGRRFVEGRTVHVWTSRPITRLGSTPAPAPPEKDHLPEWAAKRLGSV